MITPDFIAAGGNGHSSAADWVSGLLVFGSGNNVALWNPEDARLKGIYALLQGHTDVVSAVKVWDEAGRRSIISGGADKSIRIWKSTTDKPYEFEQDYCLKEHTGSVNVIASLPGRSIFATGSADGTVKVWQYAIGGAAPECLQTIHLKPRILPITIALASLCNGQSVLTVAGTSTSIQVYVQTKHDTEFVLHAVLTGHEGWIRSLDFVNGNPGNEEGDLLLASASQDKYVRLWRIARVRASSSTAGMISGVPAVLDVALSNKTYQIGDEGARYMIAFEALLIGHEDWIYTARWCPDISSAAGPTLLTASADNSLSIWTADHTSGVWICNTRLGEISVQKGSTTATGSTGGFWVGLWQPDAQSIISLGRTGSWRRWMIDKTKNEWTQTPGISGHVDEVRGLCWSPDGSYLLSSSADQTTRLWAEWQRDDAHSWHEISRPQIHGYDLNCIDSTSVTRFVSGADEKLLRVFDMPKDVANLLTRLSGISPDAFGDLSEAANIPVLGLSNKAVAADSAVDDTETDRGALDDPASDTAVIATRLDLQHPPLEDHLSRHTLWPEHEKLYGHGYEISAVAASRSGNVIATACKASSIDHAVIRLYEGRGWREVKPCLTAHTLTVTNLAFSPDDKYLLSVGRDRQWAMFTESSAAAGQYESFVANVKGHSRMILDCSWAPLQLGYVFATAGRDKSIKIWRLIDKQVDCVHTIAATSPVTAVAFDDAVSTEFVHLAFGTEDGKVHVFSIDVATLELVGGRPGDVDPVLRAGSQPITRLRWRPLIRQHEGGVRQLAVSTVDATIWVVNVT